MADSRLLKTVSKTRRTSSHVWLVGPASDKLLRNRLPTCRQVLSLFFHQHVVLNMALRESSRFAIREVFELWNMARIPTTIERNAIEKLEKLFDRWIKLKKNRNRRTPTQTEKEAAFQVDMEKLFDVAHAEAMSLIRIPEDRAFLEDQRSKRKGYMGKVDTALAKKEERIRERKLQVERRVQKEKVRQKESGISTGSSTTAEFPSKENSTSSDDGEPTEPDYTVPSTSSGRKKPPATSGKRDRIISPEVASVLDRANVSDRTATFILSTAAQTLGHDVSEMTLSRTSIRSARIKHRTESAAAIKNEFTSSGMPLTAHWDGKILSDITGKESVERLAVLVSGYQLEKLLGVPKLPDGTAESASNAVLETLRDWGIADQVKALSFDTTAVNTGRKSGTCLRIEKNLGRDLLYLACRHHVHEIVLGDVFTHCFGPSSGP